MECLGADIFRTNLSSQRCLASAGRGKRRWDGGQLAMTPEARDDRRLGQSGKHTERAVLAQGQAALSSAHTLQEPHQHQGGGLVRALLPAVICASSAASVRAAIGTASLAWARAEARKAARPSLGMSSQVRACSRRRRRACSREGSKGGLLGVSHEGCRAS